MDIVVEPVSEDVPADAEPASPEQPTTEVPEIGPRTAIAEKERATPWKSQ